MKNSLGGMATLAAAILAGLVCPAIAVQAGASRATESDSPTNGCLACHDGIEEMHPEAQLSCVDCHGGDAGASKKLLAHVRSKRDADGDERVAPLTENLAYRRFRNPMDLRVLEHTCGQCHDDAVHDLTTSLHGTTAGHLSDGFYEMGLLEKRGSVYGVFPVTARAAEGGEVERLLQVPPFKGRRARDELSTHFTDLARKECMQCHLWSSGRAVRGRVGFDGDYRGEGCAACHVTYALNGFSESADRAVSRNEPGHPLRHELTRRPTTQTCTTCHYGDASIGLHFRGLSQLPPGAPGGPEIPGTTDAPLNRLFYLNDAAIVPPDVHHERGLHCIDCHTLSDVMGDGQLHGQMEHAVEISCEACHGTLTQRSTLKTERGTPLEHLFEEGGEVFMRGKVSGRLHRVKQVVDVIDATHADFNSAAQAAMTGEHANVECYTCHAAWNTNFLGFHFYRNEEFTQLDLLSGLRTPGRVTTQEKVFATWKSFYAGLNERGKVAPFLTGFSTMGTVDDAAGKRVIDQGMPVTAAGLSGMTMVHHQLHSVRPTARSCVECHRSSATWGLGSANFRLARQFAFIADRRGIEIVAINRGQVAASVALCKIVLPDVIDIEVQTDALQGFAQYLYVAEGGRGIHVIDVRDPLHPERVAFVESVSPRGMQLAGDYLYSADGVGGLRVYDVSEPHNIKRVGVVPMFDAHEVTVQWPYAYVADGPGGLVIVDIRAPIAPRAISGLSLVRRAAGVDAVLDVAVLFQYSRPQVSQQGGPADVRSTARNLCAVVDENEGLFLVDVTEPTLPSVIWPKPDGRTRALRANTTYRGLSLLSHVDLATPQGGKRTFERDYVYLLRETRRRDGRRSSTLQVIDVSDPGRPRNVGDVQAGFATEKVVPLAVYNQPFLRKIMLTPGELGVYASDVSTSDEPVQLGFISSVPNAYVVAIEEFPLDKMIDAEGRRLKDVSHEVSRWLYRSEIDRLLSVPARSIGTSFDDAQRSGLPGGSARVYFAQLDRDRNGLLTGEEYTRAGGEATDSSADGRITLSELAALSRSDPPTRPLTEVETSPFIDGRVDADGDLARLLDGVDGRAFDHDDDSRLDRKEMTRALFFALDLDADKRLSLAELSRHPGELRRLRYGDVVSFEQFDEVDWNRGGTVTAREFRMRSVDWQALDVDDNGYVQLEVLDTYYERERGIVPPRDEWPHRQVDPTGLPPGITVERLLATFDRDGNLRLSRRELKQRSDLFEEFDRNRDEVVQRGELQRRVDRVAQMGVDVSPDSFEARWDLDGDGKLSEDERPPGAEAALARVSGRRR